MTKLNKYFDNELSAQEQLEVQMWLAEHGGNPDSETQLAELFDSLHVDDDTAAVRLSDASPTGSGSPEGSSPHPRAVRVSSPGASASLPYSSFRSCAPSGCSTPTGNRRSNGSSSRFPTARWPP